MLADDGPPTSDNAHVADEQALEEGEAALLVDVRPRSLAATLSLSLKQSYKE